MQRAEQHGTAFTPEVGVPISSSASCCPRKSVNPLRRGRRHDRELQRGPRRPPQVAEVQGCFALAASELFSELAHEPRPACPCSIRVSVTRRMVWAAIDCSMCAGRRCPSPSRPSTPGRCAKRGESRAPGPGGRSRFRSPRGQAPASRSILVSTSSRSQVSTVASQSRWQPTLY